MMKSRARPALTLWAVCIVMAVAAVVLQLGFGRSGSNLGNAAEQISIVFALLVFATVGAAIVARRPEHAIGWIYLLGALVGIVGSLASAVTNVARVHDLSGPGITAAFWLNAVLAFVPLTVLVPLPLLLFPNGRLPSRRWRFVMFAAVASNVLIASRFALSPGHIQGGKLQPINPLGIAGAKSTLEGLAALGTLVLVLATLAAVVSLFIRFHRASGIERQQLKWLGWAGVLTIFLVFMAGPGTFSGALPDPVIRVMLRVIPYLLGVAISLIPLATAVAILRYRLFEIDRIVSRTLSYAIVSAMLAGTFALVVLVPSALIGSRTQTPSWLVAAATLTVAVVFQPLRGRVQRVVDHRFDRARYDAARTIDDFTARLRDQIDLNSLGTELEGLVARTMQPSHVSLWLINTQSRKVGG